MAGSNKKDKFKKRGHDSSNDLTRIEDLSQLIHKEDPEIEALFRKATNLPELPSEEDEERNEELVETTNENLIEESLDFSTNNNNNWNEEEQSSQIFENQDSEQTELETDVSFENELENEEMIFDSSSNDFNEENTSEDNFNTDSFNADFSSETTDLDDFSPPGDLLMDSPEEINLEEINFEETNSEELDHDNTDNNNSESESSNFNSKWENDKITLQEIRDEQAELNNSSSFGYSPTVANPAYSLKIENLDPRQADDIIDILVEYDLIKHNNEKDFRDSLKSGALLISQQSEFLIIHLATKLKRFGASMIMGPSDKIFSSKIIASQSSRGKITKKIKDQSKKGMDQISNHEDHIMNDFFFVHLVGENFTKEILEDFGPIYATEVIDEEDLIRSSFAQKSLEQKEKIQNDELPLFEEYAHLIDTKKEKLQKVLKAKALSHDANAIINMQFLMNTQSVKKKTLLILTAEARAVKIQDEKNIEYEISSEAKDEL